MSARVRVVHLAGALGLGGVEKTLQLLAAHLDRTRFEPVAVALADGPRAALLRAAGVEVRVPRDPLRDLQQLRPDIIHLHRAGWTEPTLLRLALLSRAPHLVETNVFGRHDPSPAGRRIELRLFVSRFCRDRYLAALGLPAGHPGSDVLYNPVDTDFHAAFPYARRGAEKAVGRVSRADPGKWSPLALDMLPHLARLVPDFRYRVLGATPEARDWVAGSGLAAQVEFCDPVRDEAGLAGFLDTVSVLAHANATGESFGLAIAEAMAAGLPVVTHPCPPPRDNAQLELVEHGRTGLVADSAEDYASAVAWLLRHPDEARRMGRAGQDKARALYRAQSVARRLETFYDALLAPHAHIAPPQPAPALCRVHG